MLELLETSQVRICRRRVNERHPLRATEQVKLVDAAQAALKPRGANDDGVLARAPQSPNFGGRSIIGVPLPIHPPQRCSHDDEQRRQHHPHAPQPAAQNQTPGSKREGPRILPIKVPPALRAALLTPAQVIPAATAIPGFVDCPAVHRSFRRSILSPPTSREKAEEATAEETPAHDAHPLTALALPPFTGLSPLSVCAKMPKWRSAVTPTQARATLPRE